MAPSHPKATGVKMRKREAITDRVHSRALSRYVSLSEASGLLAVAPYLESKGSSQSETPLHVEISDILWQSMKRYRFVASPRFLVKQIFCPQH